MLASTSNLVLPANGNSGVPDCYSSIPLRELGSCYRVEQVRAQRLQGDRAEQEALMTIAQSLAAEEVKVQRASGRGRGARGNSGRGNRKAVRGESPKRDSKCPDETGVL